MDITNLTATQLRAAADLQEKILGLQDQLNQLLGGEVSAPAQVSSETPETPTDGRRKRKMTEAWRKALARAHAARRAKAKAAKKAGVKAEAAPAVSSGRAAKQPRAKKQVSEAKLKALAKAREARWAKVRAVRKAKA
jgi:membrane protein involved in colicin uptake